MALGVKNPPANAGNTVRFGFSPWVWKIPWRRAWQPAPVFFPRESHGQRRLSAAVHRVTKSQTQWSDVASMHELLIIKILEFLHSEKEWKSYLLSLKLDISLGSFLFLTHDNGRKSFWLYLQNLSRILPLLTAFTDTTLIQATIIFYLGAAVAPKLVFQLLHFFTTI